MRAVKKTTVTYKVTTVYFEKSSWETSRETSMVQENETGLLLLKQDISKEKKHSHSHSNHSVKDEQIILF